MNEVAKYLKNLSSSVKYASIESFKEIAPNTAKLTVSLAELNSSMTRDRVKSENATKRISQKIKSSKPYSALELFKKSIREDIATGQFYNKDRKSQVRSKLMGFDDDIMETYNMDTEDEEVNVSIGDQVLSVSFAESSQQSAEAISGVIAQTTEYAVQAANTNTMLMYSQAMEANKMLNKGLQNINENIANIITHNNTIARTHADNAMTYYKTSTETLGKILEVLNEIHNIEVSRYPGDKSRNKSKSDKIGDLTSGGVPDLTRYFGNVKKNFLNNYGHLIGLTDGSSISPITSLMFDIASSPLSEIPKALAGKAIKSTIGESLERFDKTIANVFSSVILRVNNMVKESFDKKAMVISDLFGIDNTLKSKINTSKYNKEAMQWNGIAQKTLVEVIPTYLRQIASAVTGSSEKVYNYDKGKFIDAETLKKDFENIKQSEIRYGMDDIYRTMRSKSSKVNMSAKERENFNGDMMKFFEYYVNTAKPLDLNSTLSGLKSDTKFGIERNTYNQLSEIFKNVDNISLKGIKSRKNAQRAIQEYMAKVQEELFQLSGGKISKEDIAKFTSKSINALSGKKMVDDSFEQESVLTGLDIDPDNFKLIKQLFKSMPKHIQGAFDKNVMQTRDEITSRMEKIEADPNSVFYNLFNDSNPSSKSKGGLFGSLVDVKDSYSYSIFDYLRGIYNTLIDRNNTPPSGKKKKKGRKPGSASSSLSNAEVSAINDSVSDVQNGRKSYSDLIGSPTLESIINEDAASAESTPNMLDKFMTTRVGNKMQPFIDSMKDFVNKPAKMLSAIMDTVDTRLYQVFYGIDGQMVNGRPVNGVFDVMVNELKDTFSNLNTMLEEKVFNPLKEKFNEMGGLRGIYESTMKKMGMDPYDNAMIRTKDKIFGSKRRGVEGYMTPIFNQAGKDFKDAKRYAFDTAKDVYSSLFEQLGIINPKSTMKGQTSLFNESLLDKLTGKGHNFGPSTRKTRRKLEAEYIQQLKQKGLKPNIVDKANKVVNDDKGVMDDQMDLFSAFSPDEQQAIEDAANRSGVDRDDMTRLADNIDKYAKGARRINKTKIVMVHKGERILTEDEVKAQDKKSVPNEEDDDDRTFVQKMMDTLRAGIDNVSEAVFGYTPDKDKRTDTKDFLYSFKNIAKDYIPEIGSGALWGALGGVFLGPFGLVGNTLLGAALGSSTSLLSRSKEMQNLIFGEYDPETQSRSGGLLSGELLDKAEKVFPHIKKGALTGAVTAMLPFVPGGPLAGLMVGSVLGFANRNGAITEALFGEEGIIGKDVPKIIKKVLPSAALGAIGGLALGPFGVVGNILLGSATGVYAQSDQFKDILFGEHGILKDIDQAKMKKLLPKVATGAVAGMFMGPFGLVGNAFLGSALGFVTTTDKFKEMIFGKDVNGKKQGGLFGAVKSTIQTILGKNKKSKKDSMSLRDILAKQLPLTFRETTEPYIREFAYQSVRFGKYMAKKITHMMEKSVMGKIIKGINNHIIKPMAKTFLTKILPKAAIGVGAALLAPVKLLQGGSKAIMKKQMKEGRGDYLKQSTLEKLLNINPKKYKVAEDYLDPKKKRKEERMARKRRKKDRRSPEDVAKDTDLKVETTNTLLEKILVAVDKIVNPKPKATPVTPSSDSNGADSSSGTKPEDRRRRAKSAKKPNNVKVGKKDKSNMVGMPTEHGFLRYEEDETGELLPDVTSEVYKKQKEDEDREDTFQEAAIKFFKRQNKRQGPKEKDGEDMSNSLFDKLKSALTGDGAGGGILSTIGGAIPSILTLAAPLLLSEYYGLKGRVDEKMFIGTGKTAVSMGKLIGKSLPKLKSAGGAIKNTISGLMEKFFPKAMNDDLFNAALNQRIVDPKLLGNTSDDTIKLLGNSIDEPGKLLNNKQLALPNASTTPDFKFGDDLFKDAIDVDFKPEKVSFIDNIKNALKNRKASKAGAQAMPEILEDGTILIKQQDEIISNMTRLGSNGNVSNAIAKQSDGIVGKFINSAKGAIDNMVKIITKMMPDLATKTDDIFKIFNKLLDPKILSQAKFIAKIAAGVGKTTVAAATFLFSDVVTGVWGGVTGCTTAETANLFMVSKERVDMPMKMISGVIKAILNVSFFFIIDILNEIAIMLMEKDFIKYLATSLYGIFMGSDALSTLKTEQDAFMQRFNEAKSMDPELTLSDYNDAVNKGVFDSISTWIFGGDVYNERTNQVEQQGNIVERVSDKVNEYKESIKDTVAKSVAKSSDIILNKFIPAAKSAVNKMVSIVTKMVPDLAPKSKQVLSMLEKLIDPKLLVDAKIMAKMAAGLGKTTISAATFLFSDVVTGTWGLVSGFFSDSEVANLFQVPTSRVDIPMRMISAAIKSILSVSYFFVVDILNEVSKMAFGIDFINYLATSLYELVASDDAYKTLEAEQGEFLKKFQAAKDIDPTLTFDKFNDVVNMSVIDKVSTWIFGGDEYDESTGTVKKKQNVVARATDKVKGWFGFGKKDYTKTEYEGINYGDMKKHVTTNRTMYVSDKMEESAMGKGKKIKYGTSKANEDGSFYSQNDPAWANLPYMSSNDTQRQTIGDSGCGPVVGAMVAKAMNPNNSANPLEAAQFALKNGYKETNGGTTTKFFDSYLGNKGIQTSQYKPTDESSLRAQLQQGPVVLMGQSKGGNTPFGKNNPHYVMATGVDNSGKLIVNDPYESGPTSVNMRDTVRSTITGIATANPYQYGTGKISFKDIDGNAISPFKILEDVQKAFGIMGSFFSGKDEEALQELGVGVQSEYYDSTYALDYDANEAARIINNEFIRRNSKLRNSDIGGQIVRAAKVYNLDPYLMAAISIMETGGTSSVLIKYNNPAGLMDPSTGSSKPFKFNTLYDGYLSQGKTLSNLIYNEKRYSVKAIGERYCPVGAANDPNGTNRYWVSGVTGIYKRLTGKDPFMIPSTTPDASTRGNTAIEKMISYGSSKLGAPYVWGAPAYSSIPKTTVNSFDCSGLVSWAGYHAGMRFPNRRETSSTFYSTVTDKISKSKLSRGDLGFRLDGGQPKHVGIYLGDNKWLQTRREGEGVIIGSDNQWTNYGRIKTKYMPKEPGTDDKTVAQRYTNTPATYAYGKGKSERRQKNNYESMINTRQQKSTYTSPAQSNKSNTTVRQSIPTTAYGNNDNKGVNEKFITAVIELLIKVVDNTAHLATLVELLSCDTSMDKSTKDNLKNVAESKAKERAKAISSVRDAIDKSSGRDLEQLTKMLKAIAAQ